MKLEHAFVVRGRLEDLVALLDDDETFAALFPNTTVVTTGEHVRETCTPYRALGQEREIRFIFETLGRASVRFAKICDGNVWRSLEGEISLAEKDAETTRVSLRMNGATRAFVPELTIRGPMRDQIARMARALTAVFEGR